MSTNGDRVKSLPVILNEIDNYKNDWHFKKVQFLARALLPYGQVDEADSIPKLCRKLKEHRDTTEAHVFLLKRVLDSASVDQAYTGQLTEHVTCVWKDEKCPKLLFREMLLKVAEEIGRKKFFGTFLGIVGDAIKQHPENIKDMVELFQHLINIGVLKNTAESLGELLKWLGSVKEDVKPVVEKYMELHHPQSTGSCKHPIQESQPEVQHIDVASAVSEEDLGSDRGRKTADGGPSGKGDSDVQRDHAGGATAHEPEHVGKGQGTTKDHVCVSDEGHIVIPPGDLVKEPVKAIGQGQASDVYRGRWISKGEVVAIKVARSMQEKEHPLKRDIAVCSKLKHPNIIKYFGVSSLDDRHCIVMELAAKGSLYDYIHKPKHDKNPPLPQSLDWAVQIARGVRYLHDNGITHRDLKSPNVLLAEDLTAKICDMGLIKETQKEKYTPSQPAGTPWWNPPEAFQGKKVKVSNKWDVYSYGIVLWELMTHDHPFSHLDLDVTHSWYPLAKAVCDEDKRPEPIPDDPEIAALMKNCWSKDPDSRPSFSEIVVRLEKIMKLRVQ